MLARCILANTPRGGRSHWWDTLKLVLSRIQRWRDGESLALWSEVVVRARKLNISSKSKVVTPEFLHHSNADRARQAVEDGQFRKALQSLTAAGLAQPSTEVFNEMLAKHRNASCPSISNDPVPSPVKVVEGDVARALRSFPNGSAPGPSGLRGKPSKASCVLSLSGQS